MALDDLNSLQDHLPGLFDMDRPRGDWDTDYILVPIEDPESTELLELEEEIDLFELAPPEERQSDSPNAISLGVWDIVPSLPGVYGGTSTSIPGSPLPRVTGASWPLPPDALASYLPFHYFPAHVWGIYLTVEGVIALREHIRRHSGGRVGIRDATHAARAFLHAHEFFHHQVESFATRLEVDRRTPVYRTGFETLYRRELAADCSSEEALATAQALIKVGESARKRRWPPIVRNAVLEALRDYIGRLPANYNRGLLMEQPEDFREQRDELAEASRSECFGGPPLPGRIWRSAPHCFRGIADVKSNVNYVVRRGSPVALRHRLEHRYFRQREVLQTLQGIAGLELDRRGANHDIYRTRDGRYVTVPRHRVLADGTVRQLIRSAGLSLSLEQFRAA